VVLRSLLRFIAFYFLSYFIWSRILGPEGYTEDYGYVGYALLYSIPTAFVANTAVGIISRQRKRSHGLEPCEQCGRTGEIHVGWSDVIHGTSFRNSVTKTCPNCRGKGWVYPSVNTAYRQRTRGW
jgi:hypothetical protein